MDKGVSFLTKSGIIFGVISRVDLIIWPLYTEVRVLTFRATKS